MKGVFGERERGGGEEGDLIMAECEFADDGR